MSTMNVKSFYGKRKMMKKVVRRVIPVESDDSQLSSDNERDEDYNPPVERDESSEEHDEDDNPPVDRDAIPEEHSDLERPESPCLNMPTTSTGISKTRAGKVKRRLLWRKKKKTSKDTVERRSPFSGDVSLGPDVVELKTPIQFFRKVFPVTLEQHIVEQTNLYAVQTRPDKPIKLTVPELEKFLGITMWMSLIVLPSARRYWNARYKVNNVSEVMTVNRWEEIKRFIHFNDNTAAEPDGDRLYKIRPLITQIRDCLNTIPKEESLCVDEQVVPFKGRSRLKQYNKSKPHKWGYKIWVLSGKSGFAYDMEVYTGQENHVLAEEKDCGPSANVVVRLARTIPPVGHKLYFDNYFTSIDLLVYLEHQSIQSVGTVRVNRLQGFSAKSDKDLKKIGRGSMAEYTTDVDGVTITFVQWYDNKVVNLLSTYVGTEPRIKVMRWFSAQKARKEIDCPQIISIYNQHMGGVDLLDSLMGLYRITIRSKKWYHRLFFHFLDMAVVNAWLLYRRALSQQNNTSEVLRLAEFKAQIAEGKIVKCDSLTQQFVFYLLTQNYFSHHILFLEFVFFSSVE